MNDMVERVARAMWDSQSVIYEWGPRARVRETWERAVEQNLAAVEIFRQFARAAIKAMREPTRAMIDAPLEGDVTAWNWRHMIDAALTE